MKINDYLTNPMGRGATANQSKLVKDDLNNRLDKLINNKKISYEIFITKNNVVYFLFKIESESKRENTYDVLLEFSAEGSSITKEMAMTLKEYDIRFFSNCPSFTYSFAYVFKENDLLIPGTENKYQSIVFSEKPKEKNPQEIVNFEKSVYFACRYMEINRELFNKMIIVSKGKTYSKTNIIEKLRSTTQIEREINLENERLKEGKKPSTVKKTKEEKTRTPPVDSKKPVSAIGRIEKIKPISKQKKNKNIKRI